MPRQVRSGRKFRAHDPGDEVAPHDPDPRGSGHDSLVNLAIEISMARARPFLGCMNPGRPDFAAGVLPSLAGRAVEWGHWLWLYWRRRRTRRALERLNDDALKDIGVHRSEIDKIARENVRRR